MLPNSTSSVSDSRTGLVEILNRTLVITSEKNISSHEPQPVQHHLLEFFTPKVFDDFLEIGMRVNGKRILDYFREPARGVRRRAMQVMRELIAGRDVHGVSTGARIL